MDFGMLGTGTVGLTLAGKLAALGHRVSLGTRDPSETGRREPVQAFLAEVKGVPLVTFAEAARAGFLVNATSGQASLAALASAGAERLDGKVLLDAANPLDFSHGFPPSLSVCNTDSLAEQIQRQYPRARVVKALNIVTAGVMVNPNLVPGGQPTMMIAGNDAAAKTEVTDLLKAFGWEDVLDLGGIEAARPLEMILPAWLSLMQRLGTPNFGFKVSR
ncbi:MAG TPA: NAD(P)-binding domain-containing protein [Deinococcales bacterium]|nr:NAD(P)-binding domain-containing protein [Deinococcales bacterium]